MRFLFFVLAGIVLGYALHVLSGARQARGGAAGLPAVWLVARLLLFAVAVGWLARAYGPAAGLAALVAAIVTRGFLARERGLAERRDRGAELR